MDLSVNTLSVPVVVAIDHRYTDNNGSYSVAYMWDGIECKEEMYAGAHIEGKYDDLSVNATRPQIKEAVAAYKVASKDDCNGTYIGCVVKLARARKAPNGQPLAVVDYQAPGYRASEKVAVDIEGEKVWVSIGCIKSVVSYRAPFWS